MSVLVSDGDSRLLLTCGCGLCWRELAKLTTVAIDDRAALLIWVKGRCPGAQR